MLRIETVDERRPPWWRTALLMVLGFSGTAVSMAFSPAGWEMTEGGGESGAALLIIFVTLVLAVAGTIALGWRHRLPVVSAVVASVAPLLLPFGNTFAFITLAALIARRRGPLVWAVAGLTALTSTWVVIADALAQPRVASILKMAIAPEGADPAENAQANPYVVAVMVILGIGLSIGSGLLLRNRRLTKAAVASARQEHSTSTQLGDEVARREERERIAREVHDALGHRLSLLGIHAGALEANADGDQQLQSSAALVRDSAEGAMDDLRSLLGVLRSPSADQPELPLTLLPRVVEESFGAGQQLSSSVFIQNAEQADPVLSRAVYRIVQELLTNARKHAPGARTVLSVTGGPSAGITIDVRNPLVRAPGAAVPGSRRGLAGIAERAELLGGSLRHGLDAGGSVFRAQVQLPWTVPGGPGR